MGGRCFPILRVGRVGAKHPENTWPLNHEYHFRMLRPYHRQRHYHRHYHRQRPSPPLTLPSPSCKIIIPVPFGRPARFTRFSHFTRGPRRGEASGKYLAFEPRIPFPDASPLPSPSPSSPSSPIPAPSPSSPP